MKVPYMKKPCENCPFRKDSTGIKFLGKERAEEISLQNQQEGFVCHKTVDYSKGRDDDGGQRRQCAGALILAQKTGSRQPFLQAYEYLVGEMELFDKDVIADTYEEFIKIQS
jgi:hypothetical protein